MTEAIVYANYEDYLAQGDIFSLSLVGPFADEEIRIFRTSSGLHGSKVFENWEEAAHIFAYDDLINTIKTLPPNQQLHPFHRTDNGLDEMVVVYAELLDYFVIASQTCDISGVDSTAKPFAAILPFVTVAGVLSRERFPIGLSQEDSTDFSKWSTVVDHLEEKLTLDLSDLRNNPFILPDKVREIIQDWQPKKNSPEKQIKTTIKSFFNKIIDDNKTYIYYLPPSSNHKIPEGYIDFTKLYTVSTTNLNDWKNFRLASIATPYREQFAQKLGLYLSRIATLSPLTPPKV